MNDALLVGAVARGRARSGDALFTAAPSGDLVVPVVTGEAAFGHRDDFDQVARLNVLRHEVFERSRQH